MSGHCLQNSVHIMHMLILMNIDTTLWTWQFNEHSFHIRNMLILMNIETTLGTCQFYAHSDLTLNC